MPKIEGNALTKLKDLAIWLHERAEMAQENKILRCVDVDRFKQTLPFLEALGYDKLPVISRNGIL